MSLFRFFGSKYFWIHTGIAIVLSIFLLWFTLKMLDVYSLHGQSLDVPDFNGKHISELEEFADDNDLRFEIIDSIYDFKLEKGTVVMQDPAAGTRVKDGRTVYLTVVAQKPEQVEMPNLLDLTLRQATAMLETYGLLVGKLQYVPDIAHNAVLKQKYKGKVIDEGIMIDKGAKIDLVLGQDEDNQKVEVPDLYGLKQAEAIKELKASSLNLGEEFFDDGADTTVSRVYKAKPGFRNVVKMGSSIDIWYRSEKKHDFNNR